MEVYTTIAELQNALALKKATSVGFVPTMGALHRGHLSLINEAKKFNDVVVCSVFVNPTQFNNAEDLKIYPRNLALDIEMLNSVGCTILFAPSVDEIYPTKLATELINTDFGTLTKVMEAKHRPGHFDGVIKVVKRLFEIVEPTNAYFGEKDYQQLCVVKALTHYFKFEISIFGCSIMRETDGLAMSSRNMNLSPEERKAATQISKILFKTIEEFKTKNVAELKDWVKRQFENNPILTLEYFELAKENTLECVDDFNKNNDVRAFIVVYAGKTRLIDNVKIN